MISSAFHKVPRQDLLSDDLEALLRMLHPKGEFRIRVIRVVWTFGSLGPVYLK